MTKLGKIKFMPLSSYSIANDAADEICAVDISTLFGVSLFPDWSHKVTLTSGTTYTVGSGALANYTKGYIWHSRDGAGDNNFKCTINDVTFLGGWSYQDGNDAKVIFFPVSTGDSVTCTNGSNRYFIPATGGL